MARPNRFAKASTTDGAIGGPVHQRDERGDGADDECRPPFQKGIERHLRLEAIGQHNAGGFGEGCDELQFETRDVEQRRDAKYSRLRGYLEMRAANFNIRHEIAMREHRALGYAGGSGRVQQEADIIGAEFGPRWRDQ